MSNQQNIFYVTTPIYYVNDRPHLGHVYTTAVADVLARYHRLCGDDTFFLTGTDEHAAKVSDRAAEQGISPQELADTMAGAFESTFQRLEMTNNDFIRTSQDRHKSRVTIYISALLESGDVYAGEYEGWYDAGQEEYVTENKARTNEYKSEVNGKPLVRKAEKNYFFRLSAYREQLKSYFEKHPHFVQPEARRKEILNRITEAEDVPISRTGSGGWGIPVPGDEQQTIYVWIDALFNYLTTVDTEDRRHYWQAGAVHLIAKDILWFHAAIWPALLLALKELPGYEWVNLPDRIYSHSYWISDSGEKMSKSLGNFLDPQTIDNYVSEFGLDALRYFLATRGPLGVSDSTFSPDLFIKVYNADLANTFGNCVSRVSNMTNRYFDGKLPEAGPHVDASENYTDAAEKCTARYIEAMSRFQLDRAGEAAMDLVRAVDSYIEQTQPFKLAKDPDKLPQVGTILYNCAEALRIASVLLWPMLPDQVQTLWKRLGCSEHADALADNGTGDLSAWTQWGQLKPGTTIEQGDPLFPRYQA
jgi:methionyl-tRNA synthetase